MVPDKLADGMVPHGIFANFSSFPHLVPTQKQKTSSILFNREIEEKRHILNRNAVNFQMYSHHTEIEPESKMILHLKILKSTHQHAQAHT